MDNVPLRSLSSSAMKQKTKDNLIYIGVALTIVAGLTAYGIYGMRTTGEIPDIPGPILWGLLSTPGIVAIIFNQYWKYRHSHSLWAVASIAALLNVAAVVVAYRLHWKPPVLVWSSITALCLILVFAIANKLVIKAIIYLAK